MPSLSLVTVVDTTEHLAELHRSLSDQSCTDWEWLIAPVGSTVIPDEVQRDPRVHVVIAPTWVTQLGAGACKKFLCEKSAGELFFDLDQHDVLVPGALEAVLAAAADGSGAAVIYGDTVPEGLGTSLAERFPASFGWETYEAYFGDGKHQALRAFDPSPGSLQLSLHAPLDGLVFTREAYFLLDGHDAARGSSSDVDLLCRAYRAGVTFTHLPRCLVRTRRHVYQRRNLESDQIVANVHLYGMIDEWCRREGLRKIDMGGAHNGAPGYETVDLEGAAINGDIRYGLPLPDNSVGCIRAVDFLEHMNHCPDSTCKHGADGGPRCMVGIMNEFHRVLAPGGWLVSSTPSSDGRGAFQDPTHVSYWNPNSFWYYTRRDQARFVRGITCRFQATRVWQSYPSPWHETHKILYVNADLVALKGQRQPGLSEI